MFRLSIEKMFGLRNETATDSILLSNDRAEKSGETALAVCIAIGEETNMRSNEVNATFF